MPLEGILLVNKPTGPTSYDVIRAVKRTVKGTKIGHCGTLDPMASGLLILLFGKSTKKQSLYMGQDKIYWARIKFGIKTDTADITGKTIEEKNPPLLTPEHVTQALNSLRGERDQLPPMFSAIKVGGTPLYKKARQGVVVERKARRITIYSIDFLNSPSTDEIEIRVKCSSGTYIRTLAEEIGETLGSVATLSALTREKIGDYHVEQAVPGDDLFKFSESMYQEKVH